MTKWCDRCPQEANSCDECKNKYTIKPEKVIKVTKEQKKKLRAKAKSINKI